jgi:CBS domain containing-hemolysin-like protein
MTQLKDSLDLALAALMVLINGFFVTAEFALVKLRPTRLETLVNENRPFAKTALWLHRRLDASLSACQLGITVASLALGWIGEPALAAILVQPLQWLGMGSPQVLHGVAFALAFTCITAGHLVVGEQAPKIFAIRNPERLALFCALPLRAFYALSYPFMTLLTRASSSLLHVLGLSSTASYERHYTEEEIRLLVEKARSQGELSRAKHQIINAVFELDDRVCRRIMVPRGDVVYFDVEIPVDDCLDIARRTKHTRYPLCAGSLDNVLGVVHLKDLTTTRPGDAIALREVARPPHYVPETMPISRLLRQFQAIHQHLAFVVDEYGTVIGIVTLENVLEQIVGPVEDEFDVETPTVVPDGAGRFLIAGTAPLDLVKEQLGLALDVDEADTLSGALVALAGRILQSGDRIELPGATAEVLDVRGSRAERVRIILHEESEDEGTS